MGLDRARNGENGTGGVFIPGDRNGRYTGAGGLRAFIHEKTGPIKAGFLYSWGRGRLYMGCIGSGTGKRAAA